MLRLATAVVAAAALTSAAAAQKPPKDKEQAYAPDGGGFRVLFPGHPKVETQSIKTPAGETPLRLATYAATDGSVLLVGYTDVAAAAPSAAEANVLLSSVVNGLAGKDGTVTANAPTTFGPDKLPAREARIDRDRQTHRLLLVLAGGRLYQASATGSKAFVGSKDADRFLASFELTK